MSCYTKCQRFFLFCSALSIYGLNLRFILWLPTNHNHQKCKNTISFARRPFYFVDSPFLFTSRIYASKLMANGPWVEDTVGGRHKR
jgi:hypothetical protein